ncbi:MAG: Na+/H+ antiporter [Polyangiaceae bacterium]|nr:Na+/H+ antiporter [Polyangiaceae bacterium]
MHFEFVFVLLFSVATAVAIATRHLKIPYTVALVIAGLVLGGAHAFEPPHLTKDFLFAVILPGLIFEAAFHLDVRKFWKERFPIIAMAIPGVAIAVVLIALILVPVANALHFVNDFTAIDGLIFGAIIVSTDPIAVVGIFKSLGAPKRLAVLIEGESLLNDGAAVVLFTIVLGVAKGGEFTVSAASLEFVRVAGGGLLVGALVGFAASQVIRRIDEAMIELTVTMIAAYGSFVIAERFHTSGVMATVVAGMLCGNYAAHVGMTPTTRIAVETFWEYLAFALNSIVFLLIGFEVELTSLLATWKPIVTAFVVVILARAFVVYGVSLILRPTRGRIPWAWSAVTTWSGLRGALSMVLVLGIETGFHHRELLVNMTFGVVILSILAQGLTMGPLLKWLKIAGVQSEIEQQYQTDHGRLLSLSAALAEIEQMRKERAFPAGVLDDIEKEYNARAQNAELALRDLHLSAAELREQQDRAAKRRLLAAERAALTHAAHTGNISSDVASQLIVAVDTEIDLLEEHADTEGGEAKPAEATVETSESAPQ